MSVTRKHSLHGVAVGATILGGITRQNLVTNTEIRNEATSGEIYARFQSLYSQRIAPSFSTYNIAAALTAAGTLGASLGTSALALWTQAHVDGSTRAGTLLHRKFGFSKGILAPRELTVEFRGDAVLSYDAVVAYDGTNDPVVITDLQTLPTITDAERFTLGPVELGGVDFTHVRGLTINFGLDVVPEGADSDIWDTFVSIRQVMPSITLRGIDLEWFKSTSCPLAGLACTHANTAIYLKKRAAGSTFVADATAEHIQFTAAGLAHIDTAMDASGTDSATCSITLPLYFDGTNAPLIIDTTAALPE